ncbi:hypothetical protein GCM10010394_39520 [Streptomyces crystallinus]|uniref:Uncharacterized protein n=1 Tax=Streptomyces crystallinus TaxID=68191 RepID=A0ABN1G7N2_9ACTN
MPGHPSWGWPAGPLAVSTDVRAAPVLREAAPGGAPLVDERRVAAPARGGRTGGVDHWQSLCAVMGGLVSAS